MRYISRYPKRKRGDSNVMVKVFRVLLKKDAENYKAQREKKEILLQKILRSIYIKFFAS